MKFKFALLVLATPALLALGQATDDHLLPEDTPYNSDPIFVDYNWMVSLALIRPEDLYSKVSVVVLPSFVPEYVVGVHEDHGQYSIYSRSPEKHLWLYEALKDEESCNVKVLKNDKWECDTEGAKELRAYLPKDFRDVKINECVVDIDHSLSNSIEGVWQAMIEGARYDHPAPGGTIIVGADGTVIILRWEILRDKSGVSDEETNPGRLVAIAELMRKICVSGDRSKLPDLDRMVRNLSARLNLKDFFSITTGSNIHLSWPAEAGHPVVKCEAPDFCRRHAWLRLDSRLLDGPLPRAMTSDGKCHAHERVARSEFLWKRQNSAQNWKTYPRVPKPGAH